MRRVTAEWAEYELIDSGGGKKLERFGDVTLVRPEAQAKWSPAQPKQRWQAADAEFVKGRSRSADESPAVQRMGERGEWKFRRTLPQRWQMRREALRFWVQAAPSGHVGVFPDQASHWDWMAEAIGRTRRGVKMLSLFAHTGLGTLAAAAAGAEATHVDASRQAVAWARENQALSGLSERPVRWIVEDAMTFVQREARRGNRYDAMMIDPPRFGRGPGGEMWKLEESLPELLSACAKVLSEAPVFVLLNVYVTVVTRGRVEKEAEELRRALQKMVQGWEMEITSSEVGMEDAAGRRISAAVFARGRNAHA